MPYCNYCTCQLCYFNRDNRCRLEEIELDRDGSCKNRYDIQVDREYLRKIKNGEGKAKNLSYRVDSRGNSCIIADEVIEDDT